MRCPGITLHVSECREHQHIDALISLLCRTLKDTSDITSVVRQLSCSQKHMSSLGQDQPINCSKFFIFQRVCDGLGYTKWYGHMFS